MNLSSELDKKSTAVIRSLIMDGVSKANSGHPGGAMSSTDMAYILFRYYLNYNPDNPQWINRDRFVLSAGHESMLLYALLHLQGRLSMEELKQFRQLNSKTPGHPEYGLTDGVDASTGPLGQGVGMGVGMAISEAALSARLSKEIIDHYTYVLAGDGDFQEPVALGAAATAGHLGLGKLIVFYDKNNAQISGNTSRADETDIEKVFQGFNWQVLEINGNDHVQITLALNQAREEKNKPTIIIGHTTMAKGAAHVEGDYHTHGAPLSDEEIAATKEKFGLPKDKSFYVPDSVYSYFNEHREEMQKKCKRWQNNFDKKIKTSDTFPAKWESFFEDNHIAGKLNTPDFRSVEKIATRAAFGKILASFAEQSQKIIGGSADLEPSNQTKAYADLVGDFTKDHRKGRNIAFAVREFPMATILNGIALHGAFKPFGATFLVFSDYAKAAMRLSALQHLPVLYVYTHDSFYVGEDGPTHQPVEQLAGLRAIPNMVVIRPADANETAMAIKLSFEIKDKPVALALTRQALPVLKTKDIYNKVKRGAYIIYGNEYETPEILLIASGSEVHLALKTAHLLKNKKVRVVSMPSMELFDAQPEEYKSKVLPPEAKYRISIEAASTFGWGKYIAQGWSFGLNHFGESAPAGELEKVFGFTPENLSKEILDKLPD